MESVRPGGFLEFNQKYPFLVSSYTKQQKAIDGFKNLGDVIIYSTD
jgi:hypothetical protein